ncbi:hypothetical protein EON65_26525 [archaeon]|nr:MAG: hypothetical protein EON65_26525 [archaeon]
MPDGVNTLIGPNTKLIISTSGRVPSLRRYKSLLQDILKLDIAYIPVHSGSSESPSIEPHRYVSALKGMACIGGAISRDIKHSIIPYLDELDESATAVQSVNTVIVQGDRSLKGYNTDVLGFKAAIEEGIASSGINVKTAVCYGNGGVTSVVTSVLSDLGIRVYLCGRNLPKVANRAAELGVELWQGESVDLFVNATPASESPLEDAANMVEALKDCKIAFDHEMPGKYLKEYCDAHHIVHIPGEKMYYPQMEAQWSLFLDGIVEKSRVADLLKQADELKDK